MARREEMAKTGPAPRRLMLPPPFPEVITQSGKKGDKPGVQLIGCGTFKVSARNPMTGASLTVKAPEERPLHSVLRAGERPAILLLPI